MATLSVGRGSPRRFLPMVEAQNSSKSPLVACLLPHMNELRNRSRWSPALLKAMDSHLNPTVTANRVYLDAFGIKDSGDSLLAGTSVGKPNRILPYLLCRRKSGFVVVELHVVSKDRVRCLGPACDEGSLEQNAIHVRKLIEQRSRPDRIRPKDLSVKRSGRDE